MSSLDDLRRRINELDRQILELVGKRQETSREVARAKRATGHATRDYNREREVLLAAREAGKQYGVSPQVAENILRLLIRSSLTTQEQASVAAQGAGSGRTALVIGGAGKMGRWFAEFMASQGFAVEIADPAGAPPGFAHLADWRASPLDQDFIVIATPLGRHRQDPARARHAPAQGRDLRRGLAQVAAARRAQRAQVARLPRDFAASDVRPEHRAALGPARHLRRGGLARGHARRRANCSRPPWWSRW